MNDLQERKIRHLFRLSDFNGDGHVDKTDYERTVNIFAQMRGLAPDSAGYHTFYSVYLNQWEDLRANVDSDNDGRVSYEEFVAHQARILADEEYFNRTIGNTAHGILATMDADRDGKINLDEFQAAHAAWQVDPITSESIFRVIDRNGDNFVTHDEMVEAVRRYYFSADPNDPMNQLMGPLTA